MERKNINIRLREVLKSVHPAHNDRLWLAGRLLWYHQNDVSRVCSIIQLANDWEDYDPKVTRRQVESVLRAKRSGCFSSPCTQNKELTSQEVSKLVREFDWDRAQRRAFNRTERIRKCLEKDCYFEPSCSRKLCWERRLNPLPRPHQQASLSSLEYP